MVRVDFCYRCGHASSDHFHVFPHPCVKVSKTKVQTISFYFAEMSWFQDELCHCDAFVAKKQIVLEVGE